MTCNYCTPDKYGNRSPLHVEKFFLRNHPVGKIKRNVTKIYREKNRKKYYFLGTRSKDLSADGKVMYRNNGFTMKKRINYCPICARDLRRVIKNDTILFFPGLTL